MLKGCLCFEVGIFCGDTCLEQLRHGLSFITLLVPHLWQKKKLNVFQKIALFTFGIACFLQRHLAIKSSCSPEDGGARELPKHRYFIIIFRLCIKNCNIHWFTYLMKLFISTRPARNEFVWTEAAPPIRHSAVWNRAYTAQTDSHTTEPRRDNTICTAITVQ